MSDNKVIAYADKSVLKISGIKVRGLDTAALEKTMTEKLKTVVRVIGVTGESIDMDVYNMLPEQIMRDEDGIIRAVSAIEGVSPEEIIGIDSEDKTVSVDWDNIPEVDGQYCQAERWFLK